MQANTQTITPFLWFDGQAEEAANHYISIFSSRKGGGGESKILDISRYGESGSNASGQPEGSVMVVRFLLDGQEFNALNGGPEFHFSEAVSFMVTCETQDEVDELWERLSEGGEQGPCGWLKDRFGLSWQIVPNRLGELMSDPDRAKAERVMAAMLQMKKIEIDGLERAAASA
jgi:predicted 3-demethylubiquinone-9 3-methyltransferase (glyoxalase superfamily)